MLLSPLTLHTPSRLLQVRNSPMAAALTAEIAPPSEVTTLDCER